jgi:hypothetical protein
MMVAKQYLGTKEYALIYAELITAAKYRGTLTYQEIAQILGVPLKGSYMSKEVGAVLGAISRDENTNGRPMLSAIAVDVKGRAGPGFFNLARILGRFTSEDEQSFWENERQAVYDTWKVKLVKK